MIRISDKDAPVCKETEYLKTEKCPNCKRETTLVILKGVTVTKAFESKEGKKIKCWNCGCSVSDLSDGLFGKP